MANFNGLIIFMKYVFPPLTFLVGIIGNTLGCVVLMHKDLINIGPRDTYVYLFIADTFYLLQIIVSNLQYSYNLNLSTVSNIACKVWNYFNYSFAIISCWLIVYISLDRFISINKPAWRFALRNRRNQLIWFLFVIIVALVYYVPAELYFKLFHLPNNQTFIISCGFTDNNALLLISYMDLGIRVILPFILMVLFTLGLIYSLYESRKRINENFLAEENHTFHKETKLAVTSICLNVIYMATQLPVSITIFAVDLTDMYYQFSFYVFFLGYAVNFFIILATNSLFRKQFFKLFK